MRIISKILFVSLLLIHDLQVFSQDKEVKTFKSVKIGNQEWMTENLNVSTFRNGDPIPEAKTAEEWVKTGNEGKPAWCYYDNNAKNGNIYGKLYNWYAVNDPRGLAPSGWHVPTDKEWTEVGLTLGGDDAAGASMKSTSGWKKPGNCTNTSGFSALPGGSRDFYGIFQYIGLSAFWWTSTQKDNILAWYRCIDDSPYYIYRTNYRKQDGFSVRCVRD